MPTSSPGLFRPSWAEVETVEVSLLQSEHHLLRTQNFCQGYATRPRRHLEDYQYGTPHHCYWNQEVCGSCGVLPSFHQELLQYRQPLDNLTSCENSKLKNHPVTLMPTALEVFKTLKKKCMTVPVLVFVDLEKPFILESDASGIGLGAVLLQEQEDGKLHPVAYASRALHRSQKNYHSSKLEFLALKWAITEQF